MRRLRSEPEVVPVLVVADLLQAAVLFHQKRRASIGALQRDEVRALLD